MYLNNTTINLLEIFILFIKCYITIKNKVDLNSNISFRKIFLLRCIFIINISIFHEMLDFCRTIHNFIYSVHRKCKQFL